MMNCSTIKMLLTHTSGITSLGLVRVKSMNFVFKTRNFVLKQGALYQK